MIYSDTLLTYETSWFLFLFIRPCLSMTIITRGILQDEERNERKNFLDVLDQKRINDARLHFLFKYIDVQLSRTAQHFSLKIVFQPLTT
ncbi:hypothetical protein COE20_14030 [Bacillus cereus]|nr:hypothetical protein CON05_04625 [Bacillus cereus]PFE49687.1 hypothetical protein CN317_04785 [Bacillus cereus]PFN12125.1 hypothetical protein COJ72_28245 [Bacillus cereus]PFS82176.1 hypothetical protein COK56_08670 [Bacillus cereus]PGY27899.1 hypothetical protein COE20_14030 [Bacillus cereus]